MKIMLIIFLIVIISFVTYKFGYIVGQKTGYINGYGKGKIDLALDITNDIGEHVNSSTINTNYKHFKDIKDITLYSYEKNGTKTIAIWD